MIKIFDFQLNEHSNKIFGTYASECTNCSNTIFSPVSPKILSQNTLTSFQCSGKVLLNAFNLDYGTLHKG